MIDGMVRQWVPDKAANLTLRIASAGVLAPLAVLIVFLGAPYTDMAMTVLAGVMAWEWARLCGEGRLDRPGYIVIGSVTAALLAGALRQYMIANWIIAAGAMAAAAFSARDARELSLWYVLGLIYLSLACLGMMWLRELPDVGRDVVLWLLAVVWATDTGAYAAGRTIGGPKMAPKISPNKTWAGLAGGMVSAALAGAITAWLLETDGAASLIVMSAFLAVAAQGGDLLESRLKRRFGVKESSNLIPGHGGLLDRLDGVLAVSLAVTGLVWLGEISVSS